MATAPESRRPSPQVALKWIVQQGRPLATAVVHEKYMVSDMDLWSWGALSEAEMARLDAARPAPGGIGAVEPARRAS